MSKVGTLLENSLGDEYPFFLMCKVNRKLLMHCSKGILNQSQDIKVYPSINIFEMVPVKLKSLVIWGLFNIYLLRSAVFKTDLVSIRIQYI